MSTIPLVGVYGLTIGFSPTDPNAHPKALHFSTLPHGKVYELPTTSCRVVSRQPLQVKVAVPIGTNIRNLRQHAGKEVILVAN